VKEEKVPGLKKLFFSKIFIGTMANYDLITAEIYVS
jgi:hypothetical protein